MRYGVAADIHGSSKALAQVIQVLHSRDIDSLLIAGDVVFDSSDSIADQLAQAPFAVLAVRGNCDSINSGFTDLPEFRVLTFAGRKIFMTHGHRSISADALGLSSGDICITGHTHIPALYRSRSGIIALNPGSAALPRGGSTPSLGIIEPESISICSLRSGKVLKSLPLETEEQYCQNTKNS